MCKRDHGLFADETKLFFFFWGRLTTHGEPLPIFDPNLPQYILGTYNCINFNLTRESVCAFTVIQEIFSKRLYA